MADFRYAQHCPLTRAVEILGERWTILILRELFLGPRRFVDLKSALGGVSPSVLADRLARLEERDIVRRGELPPPAASIVYELADNGRALAPVLAEMTRWGLRFHRPPGPGDEFRAEWMLLGFQAFARRSPGASVGALLHIEKDGDSIDIYVRGGKGGTAVTREPQPYDVRVSASPAEMMMFISGFFPPESFRASPAAVFEGSEDIVRRIPLLFDLDISLPDTAPEVRSRPAFQAQSESPRPAARRGRSTTAAPRGGRTKAASKSGRT